ncbi:MAG: NifB/NifX family molybdenum-iron cluster-binding protein [Geobacteraceae bacterium]|nr:NifB/NifX family molybdenum-iron cluster-binding protein [Geobacteraceae bacterium]
MRICFPIESDSGLDSKLSDHFGSAPFFLVADTESNESTVLSNSNQHHSHGACNPLQALQGSGIEGVAVRGIGAGAIAHLSRCGLRVYHAAEETVRENVEKLKKNALAEYSPSQGCPGHGHGGGCCH